MANPAERARRPPAHPIRRITVTEVALLTILPGLAAAAWLALITAGADRFAPRLAAVAGAAVAIAGLAVAGWGHARGRSRIASTRWDVAALVIAAVLAARAWPVNTPWITFLDASWYAATAARIAQVGGLRFPVDALTDAPADARPALVATFRDERAAALPFPDATERGFHVVAFAVEDTSDPVATPYHPPYYAAGLAVAAALRGPLRAGDAAWPWALAWLLAVAAVARAAGGARAAPLAVVAAGCGPAFGYYAANPYAELAAGALALGGVWCLVRMAGTERPARALAIGAGLGLGLACLAKVDLIPTAAAAAAWWVLARRGPGGWGEGAALAAGFALPAAHGLWLASTVSRLYVDLNGGGVWDRWAPAAPWIAVAAGALWGGGRAWRRAARRPAPDAAGARSRAGRRAVLPPPTARTARLAAATAGVLALAAAFAAGWRQAEGEPAAMTAILAWLMTPLGVWAAAAGVVGALDADDPRPGPVVALALTVVPLVLFDPVVARGLSPLYAARRLVPTAVPVVAILAALAAARGLTGGDRDASDGAAADGEPPDTGVLRGAGGVHEAGEPSRGPLPRPARRPAAPVRPWLAAAGIALVAVAQLQAAGPFSAAAAADFGGGPRLARSIAEHADPDDVVVFASTLGGLYAGRVAAAVWILEGRDTVVVGDPAIRGASLAAAFDAWRAAGRGVLWVDDGRAEAPAVPGYGWSEVGQASIVSRAPAPVPALPARMAPLPVDLRIRRAEAAR